jgi:hypothetical protein
MIYSASNDWSCIRTDGSPASGGRALEMPAGRYGHAVCMWRNKFMMFGGQVDLTFFDDLWMFDLGTSQSSIPAPNCHSMADPASLLVLSAIARGSCLGAASA